MMEGDRNEREKKIFDLLRLQEKCARVAKEEHYDKKVNEV